MAKTTTELKAAGRQARSERVQQTRPETKQDVIDREAHEAAVAKARELGEERAKKVKGTYKASIVFAAGDPFGGTASFNPGDEVPARFIDPDDERGLVASGKVEAA